MGTGWLSEEFEALGVPFGERGRRFDEAVELLGLALAGGPFEYHGVHFDTGGSVQATGDAVPLPVVFGGNTERALRRAARAPMAGSPRAPRRSPTPSRYATACSS